MKGNYILFNLLCILSLAAKLDGQCLSNTHSPFKEHAWLSCEEKVSPMNTGQNSHWVMFEFANTYTIDTLVIWNYNVWGNTNDGVKSIDIWISDDGQHWNSVRQNVTVEKAPGSWKYNEPDSIYLSSLPCRFLAIDVIETWNSNYSCAGISEIHFIGEQLTSTDDLLQISEQNLRLYPNPASEQLSLMNNTSYSYHRIEVFNNLGQCVEVHNEVNSSYANISVADLNSGIYYLKIYTDVGYIQKAFIKSD